MAVNLQKGQRVSLDKGTKMALVGLGWDSNKYDGGFDFDLDASAFLLNANGKVPSDEDFIFYNNPVSRNEAVRTMGDDTTGGGGGDDEQIMVELSQLPMEYDRIVFVVSIYQANERHQHFGMINNAFIRIVDADTNKELCIYNLSSEDYNGKCAMVFGELYRKDGEWKFNAIGQPMNIWAVDDLAERYGLPKSVWR